MAVDVLDIGEVSTPIHLGKEFPTPPEVHEKVARILGITSDYISLRIAAANHPESPEDHLMRLTGAKLQQRLALFVIENYHPERSMSGETREKIAQGLKEFMGAYQRLVEEPLRKRGIIPHPGAGRFMVEELMGGVRGVVATVVALREAGWECTFPPVSRDVDEGIDLIVRRDQMEAYLQIKCRRGAVMEVKKLREKEGKPFIWVVVPNDHPNENRHYQDLEIGILNRTSSLRLQDGLQTALERREVYGRSR